MTNTELLKKVYTRAGVSITWLAEQMGCSRNRIYAIMDGTGGEPTAREITCFAECLHMSREERDEIFLTEKVTDSN